MEGRVTVTSGEQRWEIVLPRENANLSGLDRGAPALGPTVPDGTPAVVFEWLPRLRSWGYRVDDGTVDSPRLKHLRDQDTLYVWDCRIDFERRWAAPLLDGFEFTTVRLEAGRIYEFGRGTEAVESGSARIGLDPDDTSISKQHARVAEESPGVWKIHDLSKTGTELNGSAFVEEELIFGDRFRIRDFVFEFRGNELRRVDRSSEGTIDASDLMVEVNDRVTGNPIKILQGVSLKIRAGEFIGILGGSGSGKSTMLNALCGIRPADEGRVEIGGVVNSELAKTRPGAIGFVPQDDIVHRELVVRDAFLLSARLRLKLPKAQREALVKRTMELLGLAEHADKRVMHLSGGQRKRVSIGIELLSKPSVLFLDEPSSGLDPATEESLMEMLQSLTLTNLTVVCTTHVLQKAYLFDRLLFVHGGRLIFDGDAQKAREHFLSSGHSVSGHAGTTSGPMQSPLEKIYSEVLRGGTSAEEWEEKFLTAQAARRAKPKRRESVPPPKMARVSTLSRFATLLKRQWKILRADWLNLAFLFSQVAFIGLLIAWVSDDFGFRMFLGLIASMWFGCSNGAQQIVGEMAILKREQVCGLGRNVYLASKFAFQGFLSCLQGFLLFALIMLAGHFFHPADFKRDIFIDLLEERETPIQAIDDEGEGDDWEPFGEDDVMGEDGLDDMLSDPEPEPVAEAEPEPGPEPDKPLGVKLAGPIATLAQMFLMEDNILDSGPRDLLDDQGQPLMGIDGKVLRREGIGLFAVIGTNIGLKLLAFLGAAMVGVGMGLAVSAWVRTETQAVMWVPLLLIPQILFGGYVITIPNMPDSVRPVAQFFPSHASQRVLDVSNLYGRATPKLANQTKEPVFLTGGSDPTENVEWTDPVTGQEFSQSFNRESEINTSWQNLVVYYERVGHHKVVREVLGESQYGQKLKAKVETVEKRNDVRYRKGTMFLFLFPATVAGWVLAGWVLICYVLGLIGVYRTT